MYFESIKNITQSTLEQLKAASGYHLVFVAEHSGHEAEDLIKLLNQNNIDFFGAIYPTIFMETHNYTSGLIIIPAKGVKKVVTITKSDEAVKEQLGDMSQYQTAFLLIDGLMDNKDELLLSRLKRQEFMEILTDYYGGVQ